MTETLFSSISEGHWHAGVALTLMHFLWQGIVIGLIAMAVGKLFRNASAASRYAVYLVTLASLPVCVVVTLAVVEVPASWKAEVESANDTRSGVSAEDNVAPANTQTENAVANVGEPQDDISEELPVQSNAAPLVSSPELSGGEGQASDVVPENIGVQEYRSPPFPATFAPFVVGVYLVGSSIFLLRLIIAVWGGHRLRKSSKAITDASIIRLVTDQAKRIGLKLSPTVAYCERIAVPTVVGVLRPMILLPSSLVTGLTTDQLSAIISHELAHIRRFDLLCNLVQRVIESLLFFHPVVWYISRRLSAERESCCDDLVVSSGYEPMTYAGALLRMAELCATDSTLGPVAVAASGNDQSQLESRIRRLMTMNHHSPLRLTRAGVFLVTLLILPLTILPAMISGVVQNQNENSIECAVQFQIAVRSSEPVSGEEINSGDWKVAVECNMPVSSNGGPGETVCNTDGAVIRMSWTSVRLHNGGVSFEGLKWDVENPIIRRDGVIHQGIGAHRIQPTTTWFGEDFEWLASVSLDTMNQRPSDRHLVFRARYLAEVPAPRPLNIAQLTNLELDEEEEETIPQPVRDPKLKDLPLVQQVSATTPPRWALENVGWDPFILPNHRVLTGNIIRDLNTGEELGHFDFGGDIPQVMNLSASGRYLLTCRTEPMTSPDFTPQPSRIQVWDLSTLKQFGRTVELSAWRFDLHGMRWCTAVSDDGKTVVAVVSDSLARSFGGNGVTVDAETGQATPIEDKSGIIEWNMETGEQTTHPYEGSGNPADAVALSPDGKWLVVSDRNKLTYWNWRTDEKPTKIHVGRRIISLAFTPDSRYLAEGPDSRRDIHLRDMETLEITQSLTTPDESPLYVNRSSLKFSGNGKWLIAGNGITVDERKLKIPHRLHVWSVESGELVRQFDARFRQVWSLDVTPDGQQIAARLINLDKSMFAVWSMGNSVGQAPVHPADTILQEMHDLKAETTRLEITRKYHRKFIEGGRQFEGTDKPEYVKAAREIANIDKRLSDIANRLQHILQKELGPLERVAKDVVHECSEEPLYGQPSYGVILYARSTTAISANELLLFHAGDIYRTTGVFRPLSTNGQGFYFRPNTEVAAGSQFVVTCLQDEPEEIANVKNGFMPNSDRARDPNRAYRTRLFNRNGTQLATPDGDESTVDSQATEMEIARKKLTESAEEAPDKLHAIGLTCRNPMGWKWLVYLPPDNEWKMYGAIRSIPHPNLVQSASEDTNYRIRSETEGRFVQLEGSLSLNHSGRWQLIIEADRPIIQGTNLAVYSFFRPGNDTRETIARYITKQEPTKSYITGSIGTKHVTRKQNDKLELMSARYIPKSFTGQETAEALLPGYCVWIEAAGTGRQKSQNQGAQNDETHTPGEQSTRPLPGGSFDNSHPAVTRNANTPEAHSRSEKGLEFLSAYPDLHELSLEMTKEQFLEIVKRHELDLQPPNDDTYSIPTVDGHVVLVMFGNNGNKCSGIQRLRGHLDVSKSAASNVDEEKPPWKGDVAKSRVDQLRPVFGEIKQGLNLGLVLHKSKQSYGKGDWIAFEYYVQNAGEKPRTIELWPPTANGRVMQVKDAEGKEVAIPGNVFSFEHQPLRITLNPNEVYGTVEGFQAGTRADRKKFGPIWKDPAAGSYTARLPMHITISGDDKPDEQHTVELLSGAVPFGFGENRRAAASSHSHTGIGLTTVDNQDVDSSNTTPDSRLQPLVITTGNEKQPLANQTLLVYRYDQKQRKYLEPIEITTNATGEASLPLADGRQRYYFDSAKPLPWLRQQSFIQFEPEKPREIHLPQPCQLTLRAVDSETGKGIPGVIFVKSRPLAEIWAEEVVSHTLGIKRPSRSRSELLTGKHLQTDAEGNYRVSVGEQYPWTYWVWNAPDGYEVDRSVEVELETKHGSKVEYTFTLKPNRVLTDPDDFLVGQPSTERVSHFKPNTRYAVGLCIVSRHNEKELVTNANWLPFKGDSEETKRDMVFGSTGSAGWRRTAAQWLTEKLDSPEQDGFRFYATASLPPDKERPRFGQFTYREDGLRHMPVYTEANCFLNVTEIDDQHVELSVNYLGLEYDTPMGSQDRDPKDNALYAVMTSKPMTRKVRLEQEHRFVLVNDRSRNSTKIAHIRIFPLPISDVNE